MPDIQITRDHHLGLARARKLAFRWAEIAEEKLDMECTYEEGKTSDLVSFKRPGASGELRVTKDHFALEARLGLLLGLFKEKIESEIVKNLDDLLAQDEPLAAFEQGLAEFEGRKAAKSAKAAKSPAGAKAKPATAPESAKKAK